MPLKNQSKNIANNGDEIFSYQQLIDTAFEGLWVIDTQSTTVFVNRRMCEMLGYSEHEILGKKVTDFLFDVDVEDHQKKVKNRQANISEQYERRFKRKDGQAIWMLILATPRTNASGQVIGSFAHFIDITEQKEHTRQVEILSDFRSILAGERDTDQVYQLVSQAIQLLIPDSIVVTTLVGDEQKSARVASIHGVNDQYMEMVRTYHMDPASLDFSLDHMPPRIREVFRSDRLVKYEGDLYSLLLKNISKKTCDAVEKKLKIGQITIMGLTTDENHLGGSSFFRKAVLKSVLKRSKRSFIRQPR